VHLVPWDARFVGANQDQHLGEKLKKEAAGILRWLVEGCLKYQRIGLAPPQSVVAATAQYRKDMDALGDFIAECCMLAPDARVTRAELRTRYDAWCVEIGEKFPLGPRGFAEQLRERGIVEVTSMRVPGKQSPGRGWQGIRPRSAKDDDVGTYIHVDGSAGMTPTGARIESHPGKASTSDYVSTAPPPDACVGGAADEREVVDL